MKIGVFGNSFAQKNPDSKYPAWFDIVGKKLGATLVDGLGDPGVGMFPLYQFFEKKQQEYDLKIFLVPSWDAYPKKVKIYYTSEYGSEIEHLTSVSCLSACEDFLNRYNLEPDSRELLEHIRNWFIVNDDDYNLLARELILRNIERNYKNTILINCGDTDLSRQKWGDDQRKKQMSVAVGHFWSAQMKNFPEHHRLNENPDVIQTHFTPETTEIFADAVYQYITTGEWPAPPEVIHNEFPIEYYYTIRN